MAIKRQSLGKGLDALLGIPEDFDPLESDDAPPVTGGEIIADGHLRQLPVEFLLHQLPIRVLCSPLLFGL
jgi:hypothetical protein